MLKDVQSVYVKSTTKKIPFCTELQILQKDSSVETWVNLHRRFSFLTDAAAALTAGSLSYICTISHGNRCRVRLWLSLSWRPVFTCWHLVEQKTSLSEETVGVSRTHTAEHLLK